MVCWGQSDLARTLLPTREYLADLISRSTQQPAQGKAIGWRCALQVRSGRYALPGPAWAFLSGPLPVHSWLVRRARPPPPPAFWLWRSALSCQSPAGHQGAHRAVSGAAQLSPPVVASAFRSTSLSSFQSVPQKQTSPHTPTRIPLFNQHNPAARDFSTRPKKNIFLFVSSVSPHTITTSSLYFCNAFSVCILSTTPCSASYAPSLSTQRLHHPSLPPASGVIGAFVLPSSSSTGCHHCTLLALRIHMATRSNRFADGQT